jgi:hypothetical protein
VLFQVFWTVVIGGCLFLQGRERAFLPPQHFLTLPMTSKRHVSLVYAFQIMVVALVSSLMSILHQMTFGTDVGLGESRVLLEPWRIPLLCLALATMVNSLFHISAIRNEIQIAFRGVAMVVLAGWCALPLLDPYDMHPNSGLIPCFAAIVFAYGNSRTALSAHRCGNTGTNLLERILKWLDRGEGRVRPFASPLHALFWMGWRRHGRFITISGIAALVPGYVYGLLFWREHGGTSHTRLTTIMAGMEVALILTGGVLGTCLILIRDNEDFVTRARGFFLTLPARSVDMARQRLYASATGIALVTAAVFVVFLALSPELVYSNTPALKLILLLCLAAVGAWAGMWCSIIGAMLFALLVLLLLLVELFTGEGYPVFMVMVTIATVGIMAIACYEWRRFPDRLNRFLMLPTAGLAAAVLLQSFGGGNSNVILHTTACLLALSPFWTLPLALRWWRHR